MKVVGNGRAALELAALGWSVVPVHAAPGGRCTCGDPDCPAPGKHPHVRWEVYQHALPPADEVRSWWHRWPSANVGVVTGAVSGVVVLDVDPRHGGEGALAALEAVHGALPDSVEDRTGGGGWHRWFGHPGATVSSGPLAPGLDLKGDGGLVVVPPSVHASGVPYRWRPGHDPMQHALAPLPDWLHPTPGAVPRGVAVGGAAPLRTPSERAAFAAAWARAGVLLVPGDRYYRCPFHDDHHPSLHVDAEGCRWYCFGCATGGGIGRLQRLLGETPPGRPRDRVQAVTERPRPTLAGDRFCDVVGEAGHQDELLAVTGGLRHYGGADLHVLAELVPSLDEHELVEVLVGDRVIGRLLAEDAAALHPSVVRAIARHGRATCDAWVRGGWDRGGSDVAAFGVVLLVPGPPPDAPPGNDR
jgi:hypothetical protein